MTSNGRAYTQAFFHSTDTRSAFNSLYVYEGNATANMSEDVCIWYQLNAENIIINQLTFN
jgi:hypothetical protein